MCIAIYKPAATPADWDAYENGYIGNPDSWGFAALFEGQLYTHWGIESFEEFFTAYEPFAECQSLIHFRIATSGLVDIDNCHPFLVDNNLAFIHNGVIDIKRNLNERFSDTWHYNELVLKAMHKHDPDFFLRPDVIYSQTKAHPYNKFAFLRADGAFSVWNESAGVWAGDGHWYSNDDYKNVSWWRRPKSVSVSVSLEDNRRAIEQDDDTVVEDAEQEQRSYEQLWEDERAARSDYYYDDDASSLAVRTDVDTHEDHFLTQMCADLRAYGYTDETLREVAAMQGYAGITALHDAL